MFSDTTSSHSARGGANVSEIEQGQCESGTSCLAQLPTRLLLTPSRVVRPALYAFCELVNTEVKRQGFVSFVGPGLWNAVQAGNVAEHLLNNRLQKRASRANEAVAMQTKQMKIGPCERVKVNLTAGGSTQF